MVSVFPRLFGLHKSSAITVVVALCESAGAAVVPQIYCNAPLNFYCNFIIDKEARRRNELFPSGKLSVFNGLKKKNKLLKRLHKMSIFDLHSISDFSRATF